MALKREKRVVQTVPSVKDKYGYMTKEEHFIEYNNNKYFLVEPEYLGQNRRRLEAPILSMGYGGTYTVIDGKEIDLVWKQDKKIKNISIYDKIAEAFSGANRYR